MSRIKAEQFLKATSFYGNDIFDDEVIYKDVVTLMEAYKNHCLETENEECEHIM